MRRALIVGIDDYSFSPLSGCVSDAEHMAEVLSTHEDGAPNFTCILLTAPGDAVTRASLRENIRALLAQPADAAFLYFAGHGSADFLGGYLVTQDSASFDDGIQMREVIESATVANHIGEIVIVVDCCHSGHLGNAVPGNAARGVATLREGISVLTASRDGESAQEDDRGGLFTSLVVAALEGGAADILGRVTVPAIYSYVDQAMDAWEQRPLLKSHVAHLVSIRNCAATVTAAELRRLPELFTTAETSYRLDPSYEPTVDGHNPDHVRVFELFQKYRDGRLLVPDGADALYWCAMNSAGCRLTPSGQFYWKLANERKV